MVQCYYNFFMSCTYVGLKLLMSFNKRFILHNETIIPLQYILPCSVVEKPFSFFSFIKKLLYFINDLPGLNDIIEAEFYIRHGKWKNIGEPLRPATTAIEVLSVRLMYPNTYQLINILAK